MRPIEFRAWNKVDKQMVYEGTYCCAMNISFEGYINCHDSYYGIRDADFELMQYTGLKDKNGKKIFEGDILGGLYEGGHIAYCDKCKTLQYHAISLCFACEGDVHWYELVEDDGKLEVIGNIYEMPELLTENRE